MVQCALTDKWNLRIRCSSHNAPGWHWGVSSLTSSSNTMLYLSHVNKEHWSFLFIGSLGRPSEIHNPASPAFTTQSRPMTATSTPSLVKGDFFWKGLAPQCPNAPMKESRYLFCLVDNSLYSITLMHWTPPGYTSEVLRVLNLYHP